MINPDNIVVDVDEQVEWLTAHRASKGLSWSQLSKLTDVGGTTLSAFASGSYNGNRTNIAQAVFRYRQTLESQEIRQIGLMTGPGYFETRTRGLVQVSAPAPSCRARQPE